MIAPRCPNGASFHQGRISSPHAKEADHRRMRRRATASRGSVVLSMGLVLAWGGMALSPKQKRFVAEYLIDLNATAAYIRTGYSAKGHAAESAASRLLRNVKVATSIREGQKAAESRAQVTADHVLMELGRIAMSDERDYATWGPNGITLKDSATLGENARCIAEVSETISESGGSKRFKLHDKVRALELLGKHYRLFIDRKEISGPNGKPITIIEVIRPHGPTSDTATA